MKLAFGMILAGAIAALAAGGGYWLGQHRSGEDATPHAATTTSAGSQNGGRKLLYYRNPMGLPDTSPSPKKDPMGMDYIPVYEGEADNHPSTPNALKISTEKIQKLGVRTEKAQLRELDRSIHANGRIEPDERRLYTIAAKFEGYVERLNVNTTGQAISKGQSLFEVYSPELVSAQKEYLLAVQGQEALHSADTQAQAGMAALAQASQARLKNWDISPEQIKALAQSGSSLRTLSFRSPVAGIVTEKKAVQGMRFQPGDVLYQVADLSSLWLIAEVFEQDIAAVKPGTNALIRIGAYPDQTFQGRVSYIYPIVNPETRTTQVRIELANPGLRLKPAMFAQVDLAVDAHTQRLTIANSAIIDSGTRQVVLVAQGDGRFEPREVHLGQRGAQFVEVLDGLKAGEEVVTTANFLIDAESNLKAALTGLSPSPSAPVSAAQASEGKPASVSHHAIGVVEEVDAKAGTISLSHEPIASLKWPAMTMEFKIANRALFGALKPHAKVSVEIVERAPGEWLIVSASPAVAAAAAH